MQNMMKSSEGIGRKAASPAILAMPVCKLCSASFSTWAVVDGIRRNLRSRRYCLTCSPFGTHNTKRLHVSTSCKCVDCGDEYNHEKKKGTTKKRCATCVVLRYRGSRKQRAVDFLGGACGKCGYAKCLDALEFHHTNPAEKDFAISSQWNQPWCEIEAELRKCVLLCANCHREAHSYTRKSA